MQKLRINNDKPLHVRSKKHNLTSKPVVCLRCHTAQYLAIIICTMLDFCECGTADQVNSFVILIYCCPAVSGD